MNIERFLFLVVQLSFFVFASPSLSLGNPFASTPNSKRRHLAKHLTAYHHHAHHHHQQKHHHSHQQQQQHQQQQHQQQQHQQQHQQLQKYSTQGGARQQQQQAHQRTATVGGIPRPSRLPSYATATATSATSYASTAQLTRCSGKGMRLFGDGYGFGYGYGYGSISSSTRCEPIREPSLWYNVLALPFDDQKLGRREFSSYGRGYRARAGLFSNSHM